MTTARLRLAHRACVVDTLTPLVLYDRLRGLDPTSFLLESLEGGERWARYSFLGVGAALTLVGFADRVEVQRAVGPPRCSPVEPGQTALHLAAALLAALGEGAVAPDADGRLPGGAVGWIAWDAARLFEPRLGTPPPTQPLFRFVVPRVLLRFDLLKQRLTLTAAVEDDDADPASAAEAWLDRAMSAAFDRARDRLDAPLPLDVVAAARVPVEALPAGASTTLPRDDFEAAVERAREFIRAGDIIQVVLSQRLRMPWAPGRDVLDLYRRLRLVNPSPYLFLLDLPDAQLVGASPEVMVRKTGRRIEVRPIAGTRRRGRTEAEDLALADELRADPKEVAEHIMLVDLGRNDVGRVAEPGSVSVDEQLVIERYSHVMHLVSHVTGTLKDGLNWADVVGSVFPAGTLSGAPKVRAMEIIDDLEPEGRQLYGGAVGYVDLHGDMDLCITIRTVHIHDGVVDVQAGAGIVADSQPHAEWLETLNKAGALLRTLVGSPPT